MRAIGRERKRERERKRKREGGYLLLRPGMRWR